MSTSLEELQQKQQKAFEQLWESQEQFCLSLRNIKSLKDALEQCVQPAPEELQTTERRNSTINVVLNKESITLIKHFINRLGKDNCGYDIADILKKHEILLGCFEKWKNGKELEKAIHVLKTLGDTENNFQLEGIVGLFNKIMKNNPFKEAINEKFSKQKKKDFVENMPRHLEAPLKLCNRYHPLLQQIAQNESDSKKKKEIEQLVQALGQKVVVEDKEHKEPHENAAVLERNHQLEIDNKRLQEQADQLTAQLAEVRSEQAKLMVQAQLEQAKVKKTPPPPPPLKAPLPAVIHMPIESKQNAETVSLSKENERLRRVLSAEVLKHADQGHEVTKRLEHLGGEVGLLKEKEKKLLEEAQTASQALQTQHTLKVAELERQAQSRQEAALVAEQARLHREHQSALRAAEMLANQRQEQAIAAQQAAQMEALANQRAAAMVEACRLHGV